MIGWQDAAAGAAVAAAAGYLLWQAVRTFLGAAGACGGCGSGCGRTASADGEGGSSGKTPTGEVLVSLGPLPRKGRTSSAEAREGYASSQAAGMKDGP